MGLRLYIRRRYGCMDLDIMRRKKKTRFLFHLVKMIEHFRSEIEKEGHIFLETNSIKEFCGLNNMSDQQFLKNLNDALTTIEFDDNYRYKCGMVDRGDGIYIMKSIAYGIDEITIE